MVNGCNGANWDLCPLGACVLDDHLDRLTISGLQRGEAFEEGLFTKVVDLVTTLASSRIGMKGNGLFVNAQCTTL